MVEAQKTIREDFPGCVLNFGQVAFIPGAFNIVPLQAELSLEFRVPTKNMLASIGRKLMLIADEIASRFNLDFKSTLHGKLAPTPCSSDIQKAIVIARKKADFESLPITSGAYHDAVSLANNCPVGLIFIPSTGGSHSPIEDADWADCVNGANVLLDVVVSML